MKHQLLSENHHVFKSEFEVEKICESFLKKCGLNLFVYGKIYHDKKINILSTNAKLQKHYVDNQYSLSLPNEISKNHPTKEQFFIPSTDFRYNKIIYECRNFFNIDNMIGIIRSEEHT